MIIRVWFYVGLRKLYFFKNYRVGRDKRKIVNTISTSFTQIYLKIYQIKMPKSGFLVIVLVLKKSCSWSSIFLNWTEIS
jgi:hypothetical protein